MTPDAATIQPPAAASDLHACHPKQHIVDQWGSAFTVPSRAQLLTEWLVVSCPWTRRCPRLAGGAFTGPRGSCYSHHAAAPWVLKRCQAKEAKAAGTRTVWVLASSGVSHVAVAAASAVRYCTDSRRMRPYGTAGRPQIPHASDVVCLESA